MLKHIKTDEEVRTVICPISVEDSAVKVRVSYYGDKGTIYSEVEDFDKDDFDIGEWIIPFPNEEGNSEAFGLLESIMQSKYCPLRFCEDEEIIKIKTELYSEKQYVELMNMGSLKVV